MIDPDKYTVLKTSDLDEIVGDYHARREEGTLKKAIAAKRKNGATVILPEDLFAAPALSAYAASISVAMNLLPLNHPERARLCELSDYFDGQAAEAVDKAYKIPDD